MSEQVVRETGLVAIKNYGRSPEIMQRFEEVLGEAGASGYIASVIIAAGASEALQRCEPKSIFSSALRAATLRLSCDSSTGQAYLVPFKGRATLIVGYKGLYNLAVRTGKYRYIQVYDVYEGMNVVEDPMTGYLKIDGYRDGHNIVGYIASFELLQGFSKAIYMTVPEIHVHAKEYSQSYDRSDSAWKTNTRDMERKTILRRLLTHWGYLNPADAALAIDNPNTEDAVEGDIYDLPAEDAVTPLPESTPLTASEASALLYGDDPNAAVKSQPNGHKPEGDGEPEVAGSDEAIVYGKPNAKIGKHMYPVAWAQIMAAYTRCNAFEVDGILQQLRLPADTHPTLVIDKINKHLDTKATKQPGLA